MRGLRLATIGTTTIRVHWTVPMFSILLSWYLAEGALADAAPSASGTEHWTVALAITGGVLVSLILHEAAHAVVARRHDLHVDAVTIWLLGGVSSPRLHRQRNATILPAAVAGPAASLLIGGITLAVGLATSGLAGSAWSWLGSINVLIGAANLIPAVPFDGGDLFIDRQLRRGASPDHAVTRAADVGLVFGVALIGFGVIETITGVTANGLWNIVVGLIVRDVARAERHRVDERTTVDAAVGKEHHG